MENKNTLNGFEAIVDVFNPNVGAKTNFDDIDDKEDDIIDGASEELTDEELEELRNSKTNKKDQKTKQIKEKEEELEEEEEELEEEPKTTKTTKKDKQIKEDDEDDDSKSVLDSDISSDDAEADTVLNFFDALSEKLGWEDIEDDEKPKTAEDLIEYFKEVIEENSTPQYASEEVQKLDEFVRNGGNLKDYYSIDADLDLDNIEIEDNEINQKLVIKEFLKEKGFSSKQIEKKLTKYDEAGLLEDEAVDALEALKELREDRKEQLLADQQKQAKLYEKQQQEFFNNVVTEIKGMNSIYGIDIPEKDKRALLEYIFKADADGVTKYQKDYAKSLKNLITSAYFTMKGDSLIDIAKKKGKKDAIDNFKTSLTRNKGVNTKSKKQIINNNDSSVWDAFARQLRVA